jgi:hypothetical protein
MVLYICKKCNKHFNKKQCYDVHINRKFPCVYEEINEEKTCEAHNTNKIKELEDRIKELESKNKELNKDKDIFKEESFTMKIQIKEKQELLNNKDIEIKNLYKNIYSKKNNNNDDIKIKLIQEYVYIIRESDFVQLNKNIYKIGRTSKENPEDRFQKFRKGIEIIAFFKVNNSIECEYKMIKCFSNHPNIKKISEHGKEYFQGDRNELINEIVQIVKNYNN